MKKLTSFVAFIIATLILTSCTFSNVQSISFSKQPDHIYLLNEKIDEFEIKVTFDDASTVNLSSKDKRVEVTNFDTTTVGTKTAIVSYEKVTLEFVYRVVEKELDGNFAGGNGSAANPYLISTPQELDNMRLALDQNYKLINNIDLSGFNWIPIGKIAVTNDGTYDKITVEESFSGTFDGNSFAINNLVINKNYADYVGFFVTITDATIKNLTFNKANVSKAEGEADIYNAAVLAGAASGECLIENVNIKDSKVTALRVSSLVYTIGATKLINCHADSNVVLTSTRSYTYRISGGLVGQISLAGTKYASTSTANPSLEYLTIFDNCSSDATIYIDATLNGGFIWAGQLFGGTSYGGGTTTFNFAIKDSTSNGKIILSSAINLDNNTANTNVCVYGTFNNTSAYYSSIVNDHKNVSSSLGTFGRIHINIGFKVIQNGVVTDSQIGKE